ncbi:MAG: serine protease, partial [Pseudomonadota bacterium]
GGRGGLSGQGRGFESGGCVIRHILLAMFAMALSAAPVRADTAAPLPAADQAAYNAVGRVNIAGYRLRRMCSGTLIAPDRVLTAAHCTLGVGDQPAPADALIFLAGWRQDRFAGKSRVAEVLIHPEFFAARARGAVDVETDLAVLRLETPLGDIAPILPAPFKTAGPFAILGYRFDRPHIVSRYSACGVDTVRPALARMTCRVVAGTSGAPVLDEGGGLVGVVSLAGPNGTLIARTDAWPALSPWME